MPDAPPNAALDERFVIHNRKDEVDRLERTLLGAVESLGYDDASRFAIRLALEECLNNAFKHGNQGDPAKTVTVHCRVEPAAVAIDVQDQGTGFDPDAVPDPTQDENLEIPAGRGLLLMRAYMTDVRIDPPGNRVHMRFERRAKSA
jgi:serine/threonine-protein kinase RsbW